jgi:uncharacterized protein (TIGR02246 family)
MRITGILATLLLLFAAPLSAQYGEAPVQTGQSATADEGNYDAPQPVAKPSKKTVKRGVAGDETGVKDLFSRVSQAWAAADAQKFSMLFTAEDSSYMGPHGMEMNGRKEVQKFFSDEFSGTMNGTQLTFSDFLIRFYPLPSTALLDCTATLLGLKNTDGTTGDPVKFHVYGMAVNRTGKNWQVYLMRVYAFQKPPENEEGVAVTPRKALSASPAPTATAVATATPAAGDEFGLPILDISLPAPSAGETASSGLPMPVATATPTPTKDNKK